MPPPRGRTQSSRVNIYTLNSHFSVSIVNLISFEVCSATETLQLATCTCKSRIGPADIRPQQEVNCEELF